MENQKKFDFTFILPTKGRKDIFKNIKNCFNAFPKRYNIKIIIIDGNKENFISENDLIKQNQDKILIIKQKKKGFMRACFIGVSKLDTDLFTFMYDDDYLSPFFFKLYEKHINKTHLKPFIFGNGINLHKEDSYEFTKNLEFVELIKENALSLYYSSKKINDKYPPVSPICAILEKKIINKWIKVLKTTFSYRLIFFYLMRKNIGPDLLLFLISINEADKIFYCKNDICRFSSHDDSMSIKYGRFNLNTGYWFAKLIFFKKFLTNTKILFKVKTCIFLLYKGIIYLFFQSINKNKFKEHKTILFIKNTLF